LKLQENGVLLHWFSTELTENDEKRFGNNSQIHQCISRSWNANDRTIVSNNFESLTVEGIRYAFISVSLGLTIAIILFTYELSTNKLVAIIHYIKRKCK